jgi:hypothetical protein
LDSYRIQGALLCQDDVDGAAIDTNTYMPTRLTNEIITAAIEGFESQKTRIDQQIVELRSLLTDGSAKAAATADGTSPKSRKFSAATRRRMKEAQQRRWAMIRGESKRSAPAKVPATPKRKISAAGRQAIAEAARRRWAAVKAAKEKPELSATKKVTHKKTFAKKAATKKAAVEAPTE